MTCTVIAPPNPCAEPVYVPSLYTFSESSDSSVSAESSSPSSSPSADVSAAVSAANVAVGAIPTDRAPAINNAKSCFFLIVCPPIDEF